MLFQPYIVIYQNVQGHSAVGWPPLCTKSKCFISSQNFFTLWPGKLHMISDRDITNYTFYCFVNCPWPDCESSSLS